MTATDREHLNVLAICHYVLGGLCVLCGFLPTFHLAIGIMIVNGGMAPQPQAGRPPAPPPPEFMGWMLIGFATAAILFAWAHAVALVVAGRCLHRRRARTFCMIVAGISCLQQPFGLILGVFTFVILSRPGVKAAFEAGRPVPLDADEPDRDEPSEFDRYHHE